MPETSATRTVVVTDPAGVHLRTALAIANLVRQGRSQVTVIKDDQAVPGSEMLQIATLAAEQGTRLRLEAVGPDAEAVLDALEPLFAGSFGDEAEKPA
jgi:phosphocarrier protein HPr